MISRSSISNKIPSYKYSRQQTTILSPVRPKRSEGGGLPYHQYQNEGVLANSALYQGKHYDEELRLYDFHARFYDPATGRFLGGDPQNQFASPYTGMGNMPQMMVDPDGEIAWFIPLIIGGLINVGVKAVTTGFDNGWQVLGSFAVGAATTAVTMGISNGITSGFNFATHASGSLTFGQGFAAGVGNTFSGSAFSASFAAGTTSFLRGAAVGTASGFSGGFVGGFGNSLNGGESFGNSLNSGLRSGAIGATTGGLFGGIKGGINASKNGRRFFDGGVADKKTASLKLKRVGGSAASTCGPATCESIDDSYGGKLSKNDVAKWYGGNTKNGVSDVRIMTDYTSNSNKLLQSVSGGRSQEQMFRAINDRTRIVLSMRHSSGVDHMVAVNSVTKKTITKLSGKVITKWVTSLMDPYYGTYQRLNNEHIYNTFFIYNR